MVAHNPHILISTTENAARASLTEVTALDAEWRTAAVVSRVDAIRQIEAMRPTTVVLAMGSDPEADLVLLQRIRANFGEISVIAIAPPKNPDHPREMADQEAFQLCRAAFRAGANEFLMRPLVLEEWINAVHTINLKRSMGGETQKGKLIAFLGVCGGVGTTSVACNTAVSLANSHPEQVVVVDWNFRQGDVAVVLDCQSKYNVADLLYAENHASTASPGEEISFGRLDEALIRSALVQQENGLSVLVQPDLMDIEDEPNTERGAELLSALQEMFHYVIVDAGRGVHTDNLSLLKQADLIVLLGVQDIPSIHNVRRTLAMFEEMDIDRTRVRYTLNRFDRRHRITEKKVAAATELDVAATIPADFKTLGASVNSGQPVRELSPRSPVNKSFDRLAASLNGQQTPQPKPKRFGFLQRQSPSNTNTENPTGGFTRS